MFKALVLAVALFAASPALAQTVDEVNARIDAILGPHEIYETAIKTIQFVEEDPTGTMQAIGRAHGGGAGSYRVLTLEELGAK